MRRRRAEVVLSARAVGYGSIAVSLILTGAAALADGNTLGIAGLVVGAIAGAMAGLFGFAARALARRAPSFFEPLTRPLGAFERLRLVLLAISAGIIALVGVGAIALGIFGGLRRMEFYEAVDAGIFFLAMALMTGTRVWAGWPVESDVWRAD
jgi:hypothetical protein